MRHPLQPVPEIRIPTHRQNLLHHLPRVIRPKHIPRKRRAVVEVARQAMRLVPAHRISDFKVLEGPVDKAFFRAALRPRVDGGVAVAAEAGGRGPDWGGGGVEGVEGPVPVADRYKLVRWTGGQDVVVGVLTAWGRCSRRSGGSSRTRGRRACARGGIWLLSGLWIRALAFADMRWEWSCRVRDGAYVLLRSRWVWM